MAFPKARGCLRAAECRVLTPSPHAEEGAVVMEVDHDKQVVYTETLALALHEPDLLLAAMQPSEEHVAGRLTSPIVSTHLDTRNIAFERCVPRGRWGWRAAGHRADATLWLRTQEQIRDLGMALGEDGGGQRL